MKKNSICFLAFLFLVASCKEKKNVVAAPPPGSPNAAAVSVEGFMIKPTAISETFDVTGNILPYEATEIRPEISGRVVQLNIKEGTNVARGTLLVKLFDGDLQAELKKLKVQLQIAEKTEERQRELLKISGISQQDYDLSLLSVNNIKADIELVEVNISKTEIRAPYAGRLGLRNISPGAYITPVNVLTTISQVNQMKMEFSIPEKYSSQIRNGMDVNFRIDGSNENYKAKVVATESSVEQNTRNLRVKAVINAADKYLVPGNFAKVEVVLGKNNEAIMIPTEAVIPVSRNKQVVLYRGGNASFVDVSTGIRDSSMIQVTQGLNFGDTLITTGLLFLRNGSKVKLSNIK
ncbi:efflux RND transporter periplasmic adaptor subunit [Pollutibacter soli]|uniref:efflux RND transporter periplasmic adaptor subunit n=1 Tax=Pollutibacter soli TaxID=3034157 RepID=UPI003013BF74